MMSSDATEDCPLPPPPLNPNLIDNQDTGQQTCAKLLHHLLHQQKWLMRSRTRLWWTRHGALLIFTSPALSRPQSSSSSFSLPLGPSSGSIVGLQRRDSQLTRPGLDQVQPPRHLQHGLLPLPPTPGPRQLHHPGPRHPSPWTWTLSSRH